MLQGRAGALALAMTLAAGCGSAGSAPPAPPAAAQPQSGPNVPPESSAARYILANAGGASRAPQRFDGDDDEDDGGFGTLRLPVIRPCGNGTYATDCAAWSWTGTGGGGTRGAVRAPQALGAGTPPILSFCRDGASMPLAFTPSAPVLASGPSVFALSYTGTKSPPIVTFATRWWNVALQGTFTSTSTSAPAISFTPTLTNGASRGWLVFFTWSWPADVLLVPYAINEIQLDAGSSPLAVPRGGSATLDAFDCLSRTISAKRVGSGFGFSSDLHAASATSAGSELRAPVFGGSNPDGFVSLSDDRGARSTTQVVAAPSPTPGPPGNR
ncbi:MAG TPA: hypothetical protein VFF00_05630 [Candidatus Elarobacter sp.]|nr:hypothetical protein [Candidatus Elarobacter sp.]